MKTSTKIFFAKHASSIIRFFLKLFCKNSEQILVKRNNKFFFLDLTEGMDFAILLNIYENNVVNFYSKLIKTNYVIIDVGSNIGFHTLNFAELCPKGKVYSIEPTSFGFNKLKKNINLNPNLKKVIISDRIFFSRLNIKKENKYVYASWPLIKKNEKIHPVLMGVGKKINKARVESLDDYVLRRKINKIDMIKIDVDGNEYDVIKSSVKSIQNFKPIIILEFCPYLHKDKNLDFLLNFFNKLNYNFVDPSNSKDIQLKSSNDLKKNINYGSGKNFFLIPQ